MDSEDRAAGSGRSLSDDRLLGGRIRFLQPIHGYRVAIDPVMLAASLTARPGERILDAGCGTGAASLCLAARIPGIRIDGVEIDTDLAQLARENVRNNELAGSIGITCQPFSAFVRDHREHFTQVMTNPPFHARDAHAPSPHATRANAHGEMTLDLLGWIKACATALQPGGRLTMIHRTDRLSDILSLMTPRFGAISVFPLWPMTGRPASRVIVSGLKGRRTAMRLMAGLTLHESDGRYTDAADAILRHGTELEDGPASS